jgi:hypothetical protein
MDDMNPVEGVNQHAKLVHDRLHMHQYFISFNLDG